MSENIDKLRTELAERIGNDYKVKKGQDSLIRARVNAKRFLEKRFKKNPKISDSLKLAEIRHLAEEYKDNGSFVAAAVESYDLGFYRGYMKAMKEISKEA